MIDKLLFPFRWGEQVADYGRFARRLSNVTEAHPSDFSIVFCVFVLGGSIPFLAYLGYRFVLEGFEGEKNYEYVVGYPDQNTEEDKVSEEVLRGDR